MATITVRYDKSIKNWGEDESVFINWGYEPKILEDVKTLKFRWWHPELKEWEITRNELKELDKKYGGSIRGIREEDKAFSGIKYGLIEESEIPAGYEFKTKLMPHQLTFVKKGLSVDSIINGSQTGTGKSCEAITLACMRKHLGQINKCLILCGISILKSNWKKNEIPKFCNETGHILGQRVSTRGKTKGQMKKYEDVKKKIEDLENIDDIKDFFLITNVETLRNIDFTNKLKELCDNGKIGMIILDEATACKNAESEQGAGLLRLNPKYKMPMSATFLMNNSLDFYVPLKWCGYEDRTLNEFKKRYCVETVIKKELPSRWGKGTYIKEIPKITGSINMSEIQEKLQHCMVRDLKKEVVKNLPPITYEKVYVDMTPKQEKLYEIVKGDLKTRKQEILEKCNERNELVRLRQVTNWAGIVDSEIQESAKMQELVRRVEEIVANGEKVICFSYFTMTTRVMREQLKKFKPAYITGEMANTDRDKEEERFKQDANCQVLIGSMSAMGYGLTFTEANNVIFIDEGQYDATLKQQASDRVYRIGQQNKCNIITLITSDTIDEKVNQMIEEKAQFSNEILDNGEAIIPVSDTMSRSEMFDFLID